MVHQRLHQAVRTGSAFPPQVRTRDLVLRAWERFLVQRATGAALQAMAGKIGIKVAQKTIGNAFARWAPIAGAIGAGGYAYCDTKKVGANAIELFSGVVVASSDG